MNTLSLCLSMVLLFVTIITICHAENTITVSLNLPSLHEGTESLEFEPTTKIQAPVYNDYGEKNMGYRPYETGTSVFALMMTYKHCKPADPTIASLMGETIKELVGALKYRTNINDEASKALETEANALSDRFNAGKSYGERDPSIMEQLMAYAVANAASTGVADIDKVMDKYTEAVTNVVKLLPNTELGSVSAAITKEGKNGKMMSLIGDSAAWSLDLCNQRSVPRREKTFDLTPSCGNDWVEYKQPSANWPRLACVSDDS